MRALVCLFLALTAAGCAAPLATSPEGLVPVRSSKVDELYVRPNADLAAYRKVVIDPVPVQFRSDFLSQRHALNYLLAQPMDHPYQDAESVAADMAGLMQASLVDAFRAARYEVVAAPGPGVLRISARISELFINAPDRLSSTVRSSFNRDTGQATLTLEARDTASGNILARVVHRNIVREVRRFNMADDSTNRLWFETAFRRWATNVVGEFGAPPRSAVTLAQ